MASIQFNDKTEALDVAEAFADRVHGKTVIVTGVNLKGVGYTTAEAFASQAPAHLIVTGRSLPRIQESISALHSKFPNVDIRPLVLDLSSQKAVRKAAAEVLAWTDVPSVHTVVNNAGVMQLPTRTLSEDGIEMHFATNHIGHYLFTNLIMPKIINAASNSPPGAVRVVNVTSLSPVWAKMRWSDINFDKINKDLPEDEQPPYEVHKAWGTKDPENKSYIGLEGYNQSKVANVLFSIGLNARLYESHGILSLAVHPGVIRTELDRNASDDVLAAIEKMSRDQVFTWKTQGAGAATSIYAALNPNLRSGEKSHGKENYGTYLKDCAISDQAHPKAESSDEAERLWTLSEKLTNQTFDL